MRTPVHRAVAVGVAVLSLSWSLGAVPAVGDDDPCDGLTSFRMPDGSVLCTHGDDAHLGTHVAADGTDPAPLRVVPPQCYSDGQDGYRVSVLYVHAIGSPNRVDQLTDEIRRDVGQVEGMLVDSAAAQGGVRHVRWETEATRDGCRVRVGSVGVPGADLQDLMATVRALADRGYARADRRYALYVDADRYCGIATMPRDADAAADDNIANRRTGYARVDRSCWNRGDTGGYATMGHELVHSLGAVQPDAPNGTTGGHCTDEWDPLCYDDGSGPGTRIRCRSGGGDEDIHHRQLDCGADDYFAVAPPRGSYLDRSWNTADSPYLATRPGRGTGGDPVQRGIATWPAGRGALRPSSAAAGFAACEDPVVVETRGRTASTLLGGSTVEEDDGLVGAARDVIARVNQLAGTTVLELGDAVDRSEPADGTLLLDRAGGASPAVRAWVRGDRTTRARVSLPGDRAPVSTSLAPVLEALGLGSVPYGDDVTGRAGGGGTAGTRAALRHLYGRGCSVARLDVRIAGHPSQLSAVADRRGIDLGAGASSPVGLGVEVSRWLRGRAGDGARAVVCRDDVAADCLAGAGLLADGGPLLFVPGGPGGSLPGAVSDELSRAVRVGGEVMVLGGPDAIAPRVVDQIESALPGRGVRRISGETRYDTAAAVARTVAPNGSDTVLLARGDNPADATAAAALALRDGLPVLLTANDHLSAPSAAYLRDTGSRQTVLLGGPHALTSAVDADVARVSRGVRVHGETRTSTAVAVARSPHLWGRTSVGSRAAVVAVSGYGSHAWQTALAAAPVAAHLDAPVTYLAPDGVPTGPGGEYDTAAYVSGLEVRGTGRVAVTSVVVGARLGGLSSGVARTFHALVLPALRDRMELVAES